jgi:oxygen-dependent protoporphyrinogen oxidase
MKVQTIIIGAGISGLSTAHFLSKKNNDLLVIESSKNIGGNINTTSESGFICENGPNTVLLNNSAIKELINDLNLKDKLVFPEKSAKKNRFIFHKNQIKRLPNHPIQILTTSLLNLSDKFKILTEPFIKKHKNDVSVKAFFNKRFGENFTNLFIEPFLTGIYAGDIKNMSMKHALKKVWNLEQTYGSVLKGLLKRKNTKDKNQIFSLKNGLFDIIQSIQYNLDEKILFETKIKSITKSKEQYIVETNNKKFYCNNIISTIPAHQIAQLINDKNLIAQLNQIKYAPAEVLHFGYKTEEIKNKLNGFGILTKPSDKKSFLGILFNSQIFKHVSPKNMALFTVIVGGQRQPELCKLPKKELYNLIETEISQLIETKAKPIYTNHFSYVKGIPQYGLNHENLLISINKFQNDNKNFYISGNFVNGVSVSDCIKNAKFLSNNI